MPSDPDHAELSSAETSLDELIRRITAIAERRQQAKDVSVATDLFDVERSLRAALRRLTAVRRRVG